MFSGGGYGVPPAATGRVIGWPDGRSVCVVYAGGGVVVRSDEPSQWNEIASFPITGLLVDRAHEVVLFSDFTSFSAYDAEGLRWRADVADDEATLVEIEGDDVLGSGFVSGAEQHPIRISLVTGVVPE